MSIETRKKVCSAKWQPKSNTGRPHLWRGVLGRAPRCWLCTKWDCSRQTVINHGMNYKGGPSLSLPADKTERGNTLTRDKGISVQWTAYWWAAETVKIRQRKWHGRWRPEPERMGSFHYEEWVTKSWWCQCVRLVGNTKRSSCTLTLR